MGLLDSSDMTSNIGWTEITTQGQINWNVDGGDRTCVEFTGNCSAWSTLGIIRTNAQAAAAGQVIYFDLNWEAWDFTQGCIIVLDDTAGLTTNQGVGFYWDYQSPPDWYEADDGLTAITPDPLTISQSTWYNFKLVLEPGGTIKTYVHLDDGTPQDQISSWTEVCESSTFTWTGKDLYFEANMYVTGDPGQRKWWIANFNYTDDGELTAATTDVGSSMIDRRRRNRSIRYNSRRR